MHRLRCVRRRVPQNGAANFFTAAKVSHLNLLPQGQAERHSRVEAMVETMDEYFGSCTNHGESPKAVCPKSISIDFIALMNKDYLKAKLANRKRAQPNLTPPSGQRKGTYMTTLNESSRRAVPDSDCRIRRRGRRRGRAGTARAADEGGGLGITTVLPEHTAPQVRTEAFPTPTTGTTYKYIVGADFHRLDDFAT